MADVIRLDGGQRVAAYGWTGCQYREAVVGTVVHRRVTGVGEWVYAIVLDAPQPDGTCLVEASIDDLVKLAPPDAAPAKRRRRPKPRRSA